MLTIAGLHPIVCSKFKDYCLNKNLKIGGKASDIIADFLISEGVMTKEDISSLRLPRRKSKKKPSKEAFNQSVQNVVNHLHETSPVSIDRAVIHHAGVNTMVENMGKSDDEERMW